MKFVPVPALAKEFRPLAEEKVFGPPEGHEDTTGRLHTLVDQAVPEFGQAILFYLQLDEEDSQRLKNGGVIEMAIYGSENMYPVAAAVIGGELDAE